MVPLAPNTPPLLLIPNGEKWKEGKIGTFESAVCQEVERERGGGDRRSHLASMPNVGGEGRREGKKSRFCA